MRVHLLLGRCFIRRSEDWRLFRELRAWFFAGAGKGKHEMEGGARKAVEDTGKILEKAKNKGGGRKHVQLLYNFFYLQVR